MNTNIRRLLRLGGLCPASCLFPGYRRRAGQRHPPRSVATAFRAALTELGSEYHDGARAYFDWINRGGVPRPPHRAGDAGRCLRRRPHAGKRPQAA